MLKVIFTLDYEIHGNGDGCPQALMVEPTSRMMDLFERYGAKLTIMAEVAEILKFRQYKERFGRDDYHYDAIAGQLRDAIRRGHDVQLHLHSSYFNAQFKAGHLEQDWPEYNFAGLPFERLDGMVRTGKDYLEDLLKPVDPTYACIAFRAANWSMSPSHNAIRALRNNGIKIDTSVFKHGRREGIVKFDYTNAHSDLVPWPVADDNICRRDEKGELIEIPIYSERRWIGAFVTRNRLRRAVIGRGHPIQNTGLHGSKTDSPPAPPQKQKLLRTLSMLTQRHAWKADFNQCTGLQLIRALRRASQKHEQTGQEACCFVLIGHSKLFTSFNQRSLEPFLRYVAENPADFQFGVFAFNRLRDN
jgi:hypothetical protein